MHAAGLTVLYAFGDFWRCKVASHTYFISHLSVKTYALKQRDIANALSEAVSSCARPFKRDGMLCVQRLCVNLLRKSVDNVPCAAVESRANKKAFVYSRVLYITH